MKWELEFSGPSDRRLSLPHPWIGWDICLSQANPSAVGILICTPRWREALWEHIKTTQWLRPGLGPKPLVPGSSSLTITSSRFSRSDQSLAITEWGWVGYEGFCLVSSNLPCAVHAPRWITPSRICRILHITRKPNLLLIIAQNSATHPGFFIRLSAKFEKRSPDKRTKIQRKWWKIVKRGIHFTPLRKPKPLLRLGLPRLFEKRCLAISQDPFNIIWSRKTSIKSASKIRSFHMF